MAACIAFPMLLLVYAGVATRRSMEREAERRIAASLEVMSEHSLHVFRTAEVLLNNLDVILGPLDNAAVRAREAEVHGILHSIALTLPDLQSIWVVDDDGFPIASNVMVPVPHVGLRERDYFQAYLTGSPELFVGTILTPKIKAGLPFFSLSRRAQVPAGAQPRLVDISVLPSVIGEAFSHVQPEAGQQYWLLRADGAILAQYPAPPILPAGWQLPAGSGLLALLAAHPQGGVLRHPDAADPQARFVGLRRLPGYPVFVVSAVDTEALADAWSATMASYAAFGVPATALVLVLLVVAFRRNERFRAESEARKAAEAALGRVQRLDALGQLTGGVAHDFNNLLTVIIGSVEMLRQGPQFEAQRPLAMIEGAVQRGEALTRQLLTFSRRQALATEVLDLSDHLRGFKDVLGRSLRGDIEITLDLTDQPCPAKLDPGEFELALLNLAVNARDAMPQGGRLVLALRRTELDGLPDAPELRGAFVAVSVTDTGSGIPADVLARVFDPFFTTKEVGKGTGLGLSQVYGFARQSGGAATIDSTPGRGTAVTLLLPLSTERPAGAVVAPAVVTPGPAGCRILLVEDNAEVAAVCRSVLEGCGCHVDLAADARAGLARVKDGTGFDLVLSDIVMPGGMNGLDLARELRRQRPELPVLLATGYSASADQAMHEGFPLLRKPYDAARLREALDAALRQTTRAA